MKAGRGAHQRSHRRDGAVWRQGRHRRDGAVSPRQRRHQLPDGADGIRSRQVQRLYATPAVVALVAASVITVTPVSPPPEIRVANTAIRLTADSSSIANIPINLIYAVANAPYSEVQALDELSKSLLFTGNWFVGSSTNIWGSDPADPTHWEAVTDVLVPFPALSGPAGQQLAMWWAAQYVVDASCDALTCPPLVPLQPITGINALDKAIWTAAILFGGYPFPIVDKLFRVPLLPGSSYTFGNVVDNSGPVNSYFGFEGTHPGPNGEPLMPWSGTTFTLNPLAGWENFFNSLMAPPPSVADGIHIASGLDLSQALAAVLAGLVVDFNPFEPGSPFCPGQCVLPAELTTVGIVKSILALSPNNPVITEWLSLVAQGEANGPTQAQRDFLVQELPAELGVFKFNPDTTAQINAVLNSINPALSSIVAHSGLLGAFDPPALLAGFSKLLGFGGVSSRTASVAPSTGAPLSDTGSQTVVSEDGQSLDAKSTPVAQRDSTTLSGKGSQTVAPEASGGLDTDRAASENPMPVGTTSTSRTRDGSKVVEPHDQGGNDTLRGGPAGAIKSVISKATDALKGASTGRTHNTGGTGRTDSTGGPGRTGGPGGTGGTDSTGGPDRHRAN